MFGMGFTEILMIGIVAILFLGPDKLPEAMVQIAKFFNSFRKTVNEARSTFEEELNISQLREEALSYRQSLQEASSNIEGFKHSVTEPINQARDSFQGVKLDDDWDSLDDDWDNKQDRAKEETKEDKREIKEPTEDTTLSTFKHLKSRG